VAREQPLTERLALIGHLAVQTAHKRNLDNAERSVLGGANALRAYGEMSTLADRSALGSIELRHRVSFGSVPFSSSVFFDIGHGRADRVANSAPAMTVRARLLGIGAEATLPAEITLRVAATRQTVDPPPANATRWVSRGWVELVKGF
jgi:hemolysin activation/secretion protein